jgi:hypothetical protein
MRKFLTILLAAALFLLSDTATADSLSLPDSFGSKPILTRVEEPKSWTAQTMYEHINGEAELLKRYGAVLLTYVSYEGEGGIYLSADILDMVHPLNAFGLYRLYAGCDGEEHNVGQVSVLSGDYTSYAYLGPYFLRIDFESGEDDVDGQSLADSFLTALARRISTPDPLPPLVEQLNNLSRNPCEVGFHPEHIDYDLESGPGFTWTGKDGRKYYASFFPSPEAAREHASGLKDRGAPLVVVSGRAVAWPKENTAQAAGYLENVLQNISR